VVAAIRKHRPALVITLHGNDDHPDHIEGAALVSRAVYLGQNPRPLWVVLALPFCMSLFHSTRRQMTVSWSFIGGLILVIWWVRSLAQPWRGIIDGGVVLGLLWGLAVIWVLFARYLMGYKIPAPTDLPTQNADQTAPAAG